MINRGIVHLIASRLFLAFHLSRISLESRNMHETRVPPPPPSPLFSILSPPLRISTRVYAIEIAQTGCKVNNNIRYDCVQAILPRAHRAASIHCRVWIREQTVRALWSWRVQIPLRILWWYIRNWKKGTRSWIGFWNGNGIEIIRFFHSFFRSFHV